MRLTNITIVGIVAVIVSLFGGIGPRHCHAQGVSVAPLRVLFDGRTRSATVFLSNRTAKSGTYRVALTNRRMLESGDIVEADESLPGEFFADDLIRFSPRRVTIAPYSAQTIRLLVRRPRGDVPEHVEFRTHMSVTSIPPTPRLEDIETKSRMVEEGRMSVQPVATVQTVIPILIRFGDPQAEVTLANPMLKLDDPKYGVPTLRVDIRRSGDRSVYGDLEVLHIAPDGTETQIYLARGLAVYSPTEKRTKIIQLKQVAPEMLRLGSLLVRYAETPDMHGDQEAELLVNLGPETAMAR